jgi:acetyltransferase-like isoleucine patch superfamily enzyme
MRRNTNTIAETEQVSRLESTAGADNLPLDRCPLLGNEDAQEKTKNVQHPNHRPPFEDPLGLLPRAVTKFYSLWVSRTYPFASIGRDVSFHFTCKVSRQRAPGISLGNSVMLLDHVWLNVAMSDPTVRFKGEPTVVIDDNCSIGYGSIISGKNRVHLERDILVGQHVVIQDHNHGYEDIQVPVIKQGITEGGAIRIGAGSWIGHGAAIICTRGELTIGRHCVVSANSVVMRSMPDYSVAFGMPATIIRQYDPEERAWRMGQVKRADAAGRP